MILQQFKSRSLRFFLRIVSPGFLRVKEENCIPKETLNPDRLFLEDSPIRFCVLYVNFLLLLGSAI